MQEQFVFTAEPSSVDVRISNAKGDAFQLHGVLTDLQVEGRDGETTYHISLIPQLKMKNGEVGHAKRFSETRLIKVIVPHLSAENISLAAAQAGYGESTPFEVEQVAGQFILTFREEYLSHE